MGNHKLVRNKQLREEMHSKSQAYFYNIGKPIWTERNYTEFANEAYIKNVVAHRAMNMIAQMAASIPFKLFRIVDGKKYHVTEHALLNVLECPNPSQSGKEFLESVYIYKQLSGNVYVLGTGFHNIDQNIQS